MFCGPASGAAGGRGVDLAEREQREALRGAKASSAAVSFTRSVKEQRTAHPGHLNGPHLANHGSNLSPHLRALACRGDDTLHFGGGTSQLLLLLGLLALLHESMANGVLRTKRSACAASARSSALSERASPVMMRSHA